MIQPTGFRPNTTSTAFNTARAAVFSAPRFGGMRETATDALKFAANFTPQNAKVMASGKLESFLLAPLEMIFNVPFVLTCIAVPLIHHVSGGKLLNYTTLYRRLRRGLGWLTVQQFGRAKINVPNKKLYAEAILAARKNLKKSGPAMWSLRVRKNIAQGIAGVVRAFTNVSFKANNGQFHWGVFAWRSASMGAYLLVDTVFKLPERIPYIGIYLRRMINSWIFPKTAQRLENVRIEIRGVVKKAIGMTHFK